MNLLFDVAVVIIKTIASQTTVYIFNRITAKKHKKKTTQRVSGKSGRSSKN